MNRSSIFVTWRLGWVAILVAGFLTLIFASIVDNRLVFTIAATVTCLVGAIFTAGQALVAARLRLGGTVAAGFAVSAITIPLLAWSPAWSTLPLLVAVTCIYVAAIHTDLWGLRRTQASEDRSDPAS